MKIGIYGQFFYPVTGKFLDQLFDVIHEKNIEFSIERGFKKILIKKKMLKDAASIPVFNNLDESFDLFFSIGGDGTILSSLNFLEDYSIPVIGINSGRLGFLASIHDQEIKQVLHKIFDNEFKISERSLLELNTSPQTNIHRRLALNEIALSRKDTTSMITIRTWLDDEFVCAYWADGLMISTPTGSTGYSLSCGGPIITPDTSALVLTPVAPHNLNARPLIFPDNVSIKLQVETRSQHYMASADSYISTLTPDVTIEVKRSSQTIKLALLEGDSFLSTLRKKLLWGEDQRN
jgi:NAD+ kinase